MNNQRKLTEFRNALESFKKDTRADGTDFWATDDTTRPAWLQDAVMAGHGQELPNDFVYDTLHTLLVNIDISITPQDNDLYMFEDAASLIEYLQDCDYLPEADTYNAHLLQWFGETIHRIGYVDEARAEYGTEDSVMTDIMRGQQLHIDEIVTSFLSEFFDWADDQPDDDDGTPQDDDGGTPARSAGGGCELWPMPLYWALIF